MGKTKHYQSKSNRFNNNYSSQQSQFNILRETPNQLTQLEQDLASLDVSKRLKSCMLLSDLYAFNISNQLSLNTMTTSNILNKLAMRMIDCSKEVQAHAFSALKSLTECRDVLIIKKLINIGIIRSVISISYEIILNYINNSYNHSLTTTNVNLIEDLFHILSNSFCSCSIDMKSEIRSFNEPFIPLLIKLMNPIHVPAQIIAATMQLLIAISTNECNFFVSSLLSSNTSTDIDGCSISLLNELWKFITDIISMKQAFINNEIAVISIISQYELFHTTDVNSSSSNNNIASSGIRDDISDLKIVTSIDVVAIQGLEIFANIFTHYDDSSLLLPFLENMSRMSEVTKLLTEILAMHTHYLKATTLSLKDTAATENSNVDMMIDDCTTTNTTTNSTATGSIADECFAVSNRIAIIKMISEVFYAIGAALHTTTSNMTEGCISEEITTTATTMTVNLTDEGSIDNSSIPMSDVQKTQRAKHWLMVVCSEWNTMAVVTEAWTCIAHSYVLSMCRQPSLLHLHSEIKSTIVTQANETNEIIITSVVIDGLQCMNQLVQTLQYMMIASTTNSNTSLLATTELSTTTTTTTELSTTTTSVCYNIQLLNMIQSVLPPILDLVTDTSPIATNDLQSGGGYKLPYTLEQGISEQSFRSSLLTLCESLIEFINQYCKYNSICCNSTTYSNNNHNNMSNNYYLSEEDLKSLCVQLVRCSTYPNIEICIPTAECISTLGQIDSNLRIVSKRYFLNSSLHGLLSNAILRRLQDPNAYAIVHTTTIDLDHNISSNIVPNNNTQDRMLSGCIQLMDMYMNSFIDLHTSDDKEILTIYIKLKASSKLNEYQKIFMNKLQVYQNNRSICDDTYLEKYSETLENIENFIAYKAEFINNN